MKSRY